MDALTPARNAGFVSPAAEALAVQIHAACATRRLRRLRAEFGGRFESARVLLAIGLWEMMSAPKPAQAAAARAEVAQLLGGSAAQAQAQTDSRWTLRALAPISGCPRESLRRELARLVDEGWLHHERRSYELTPRARRRLAGPVIDALAADVCASAALIEVLRQGGAAADAVLAQLRAAALATDPAVPLGPAKPQPLAPQARAEFMGFLLRHFALAAQIFNDDLLPSLLLAEIAQRNFVVLLAPEAATLAELVAGLREGFVERARHHPAALASNGYSLAECLGVSHETVRRRLAMLLEAGHIERDERGLYWCRGVLVKRFSSVHEARRAELLRMAGRLQSLARGA